MDPVSPANEGTGNRRGPEPQTLFDKQPLYVHVRKSLMQRIAMGEWGVGAALPNEIELSREYGLSSGTVRKALDWMEHAGLIVRQQGRGTFVRDQTAGARRDLYDRLRQPDGSVFAGTTEDGIVRHVQADTCACARLGLRAGTMVRTTERLLRPGEGQALYERSVVPHTLFPVSGHEDIPLAKLAQASGIILGAGRERISVQMAPLHVAEKLGTPPDEPLLMMDRVIDTIDGVPAEWRTAYVRIGRGYYEASLGTL